MNRLFSYCWLIVLITVSVVSASCSLGKSLKKETATEAGVQGTYRLILYGCTHLNDLETFAILDKEGDRYTFDPYAPEFNYKAKTGLTSKEALEEARNFITCNSGYSRPQLSEIVDDEGNTLGYELKPLYLSFFYSLSDVLDTYYFLNGDKVIVSIRLKRSVEETDSDGHKRDHE